MGLSYAEYEGGQPLRCPHCGWQGAAKQLHYGEYHPFSNILDLACPSCRKDISFVQFPVIIPKPYPVEDDREYC